MKLEKKYFAVYRVGNMLVPVCDQTAALGRVVLYASTFAAVTALSGVEVKYYLRDIMVPTGHAALYKEEFIRYAVKDNTTMFDNTDVVLDMVLVKAAQAPKTTTGNRRVRVRR